MNFAIDRELLCMCILQPILFRPRQDEIRRLVELRSRRYPVQPRQVAQVLIGSHTARLFAQQRPLRFTKKGLLGAEQAAMKKHR